MNGLARPVLRLPAKCHRHANWTVEWRYCMAGKNTSVFGIYPDRTSVEEAIDAFKAAGFRNTDISVLLPENVGSKDFAHEKHTKAPEGAATGATSGAVIGGTLGWLAGIGALTIPGLQPLLAAGPVVALLAGGGGGGGAGGGGGGGGGGRGGAGRGATAERRR